MSKFSRLVCAILLTLAVVLFILFLAAQHLDSKDVERGGIWSNTQMEEIKWIAKN